MAWYTMEEAVDNGKIPLDIARGLWWECPWCHHPILVDEKMTHTKDANFWCPAYLGKRGAEVFTAFGYDGVGFKTLRKTAYLHKLKNHFQLLNADLYPVGSKAHKYCLLPRSATLHKVVQLAFFPGLQDAAFEEFYSYASFEQYLHMNPNSQYRWARDMMRDAEKYIQIQPPLSGIPKTIIITGHLKGMKKDAYVKKLNDEFGHIFAFKRSNSWTDKVSFVISDEPRYGKYQTALQKGITVYSSQDFLDRMRLFKQEIMQHISLEERSGDNP